ncbi:hypothetical protein BDV98DRAFT_569478 [Pterulicium gracile]|uniref:Uncharacterized protein n=1 Tax=Pterulicium gracile TaxID=1884261 RepID=A0A5C3QJ29_9AGAR|nr:hypothetical protein BDV98DRAFT_569478 [Pterula gracilis]
MLRINVWQLRIDRGLEHPRIFSSHLLKLFPKQHADWGRGKFILIVTGACILGNAMEMLIAKLAEAKCFLHADTRCLVHRNRGTWPFHQPLAGFSSSSMIPGSRAR